MADAAAARREARRKRILENSQNRLLLISGKKSSEDCSKASPCKSSCPAEDYNVSEFSSSATLCYQPESNGTIVAEPQSYPLSSIIQDTVAAGDTENINTEKINDFTSFISTPPGTSVTTENVSSTWEKLMAYKYDIVLLVMIQQLLYFLFSYENAYYFIPLAIYTSTRLSLFPKEKKSQLTDVFLLMNGMPASRVQKVSLIMQFLTEITVDVSVYLFVTICIQSLLVFLTSTVLT